MFLLQLIIGEICLCEYLCFYDIIWFKLLMRLWTCLFILWESLVAAPLINRGTCCILQLALPMESITGTCFLQNYIESILALQDASCRLVEGLPTTRSFSNCNPYKNSSVMILLSFSYRWIWNTNSIGDYDIRWHSCTYIRSIRIKCLFWNEPYTSKTSKAGINCQYYVFL